MKFFFLMLFTVLNIVAFSDDTVTSGSEATICTVLRGDKIDKIKIEIIGKTIDEISFKEMYLFKLKDDKVIKESGIAEGMSGSPVFINETLIGAVAYTVKGSTDIGLILPLQNVDKQNIDNKKYPPGTSISVSPVRGDFYLNSVGTLTYSTIDGDLYMYAHPLNNLGKIMYFINEEKNVRIINNNEVPFKIGNVSDSIGYIYKDTKIGLSGKIEKNIPSYKFELLIKDGDTHSKVNYEVIKNKNTLSLYLEKSIEIALTKALKKSEYKSAKYNFEIYSKKKAVIFRGNDIVIADAGILGSLSNTLSNEILNVVDNKFKYVDFDKIKLNIEVSDERKIMYIQDISFNKKVYKPNEDLVFEMTYLLHQFGSIKKEFKIKIPNEVKIGNMTVEVSSNTGKDEKESRNLIDYLYNLENSVKNNQVMVKLKNQSGEVVFSDRINFDYYIISDKIYTQEIVIDSFEAKSDN